MLLVIVSDCALVDQSVFILWCIGVDLFSLVIYQ